MAIKQKIRTFNYQPIKPSMSDKEPPFVKVYVKNVANLCDIPEQCHKFMYELVKRMDEDNIVSLSSLQKKNVMKKLNIKISAYHKYRNILVNSGVLHKEAHNTYFVNADFFAKSKWDNIQKLRNVFYELKIRYDADTGDRAVSSKIIRKRTKSGDKGRQAIIDKIEEFKTKTEPTELPTQEPINTNTDANKFLPSEEDAKTFILSFLNHVNYFSINTKERESKVDDWIDEFHLEPCGTKAKKYPVSTAKCKRFLKKCIENQEKLEEKQRIDNNKTQYKTTLESLTDYSWAEGICFDDEEETALA